MFGTAGHADAGSLVNNLIHLRRGMNIVLAPGEILIKEGLANLQRGIETVGGRLFLTDSRLVFCSHLLNVQCGTTYIPLTEVRSVQPCWTKFLGIFPIMPNSLAIHIDGAEYRFVLFARKRWVQAIRSCAPEIDI